VTGLSVGALIRACRVRKGWSQQQLADATHTHRECISQIEHGRRQPPAGWLTLAARALDAPELLQAEASGPFEGIAFENHLEVAAAWYYEERQESETALERIREARRKDRQINVADVEQIIDLLTAVENLVLAIGRAGADLEAAHRAHRQKLRRYLHNAVAVAWSGREAA